MPHILIVDDSTLARANLRRSLEEAGYTTIEASSGQKAVEIAQTQKPDLVTLDLLMPGMSGLETLIQLIPLCPGTRYVVVSAYIQAATRTELIEAGADAFLNKPVAKVELLETVASLRAKQE